MPSRIRAAGGIDKITAGGRVGNPLRPSTSIDRWFEQVPWVGRPSPQE